MGASKNMKNHESAGENNKQDSIASNVDKRKKNYEKPEMVQQEPLEKATTYTYYYYNVDLDVFPF